MGKVTVLIAGDLCPIGRTEGLLCQGKVASLLNDLESEFASAEIAVANLECPLVGEPAPVEKNGPVLSSSTECAQGIAALPINVLALANNHILDHGIRGLQTTQRVCEQAGVRTFGAGELPEAKRMLVVERAGIRVGFIAMAENERCLASVSHAGANPLDPIAYVRQMEANRDACDYLVTLVHGGVEHYPFPSPRLQDLCRFIVERGADLVVCQHSHCAGSYEIHRGRHIIYGQGNFLFDISNRPAHWYNGFLVRAEIEAPHSATIKFVPFTQFDNRVGVWRQKGTVAAGFLEQLEHRSALISDEKFVQDRWQSFCEHNAVEYLSAVLGHGRLLRRLNRNGTLFNCISRTAFFKLNNVIQCEAHREVLLTALEQHLKHDSKLFHWGKGW